ncbi:hypothetical protein LTR15_001339 [Elasticomyces elasticus]|nr:hypothetical protein LTR15_001339 [Elasticomyces elasticus]
MAGPDKLQLGANNLAVIFGTLATVLAVAGFVVGLCQYFRMSGITRATSTEEDLEMQRIISPDPHSTLTPPMLHTDATVTGMQTTDPTLSCLPATSSPSARSHLSSSPSPEVEGQTKCNSVNYTATYPPSYQASQQPVENCGGEDGVKEESDASLDTSFRPGTDEEAEPN